MIMQPFQWFPLIFLLHLSGALAGDIGASSEAEITRNTEVFIASVFKGQSDTSGNLAESSKLKRHVLWLNADLKKQIKKHFNYEFPRIRLRYWRAENRSIWVLDEIGKEQPITLGVAIDKKQISAVKVLGYRESRGGEIQHAFFTKQFQGLTLDLNASKPELTGRIDGITGATLSVRATIKVAKVALFLHDYIQSTTPGNVSS